MRKRVALSEITNPRPAQAARQIVTNPRPAEAARQIQIMNESRLAACRARQLLVTACLHDTNARDLRARLNVEIDKHSKAMTEARQQVRRAQELEQQLLTESKSELLKELKIYLSYSFQITSSL